ncbi:hypothetical protein [Eggerthella sinensis]|uniref:SipW-cognate class signal peptide n=1 Tax=Eggerthella sinensis TaxID=242230 RepID=A0A3N0J0W3_9ACTN|nr:hypothetical protein [Eggerthella sinensis]MCB7036196.1 hypothetical protein [Eggerthella sinensis]RDB71735.1 hypothetical protein C1876_00060 [Eggerthella sinensis]RNM42340.1 hypothetical protein DMP09_05245 [Eggerthella sinensis]
METTINKKRIALIAVLAACLAAAAVAGVLAWLTVSNSVTNTFTIGSITQPTTDPDTPATTVTLAGNISENKWVDDSKIVPGSTVAKNPNIGIGKGSDSSYVYAFVKNNVATDAYFTLNSNWQPVTYVGDGTAKPLAGGSAGEYTGGLFVYVGPSGSDAAVLAGSPTADTYTGELFSTVKMPTTATAASYTGKDGAYTMDVSCYLATSEGTSTTDLATAVQTWANGLAA